MMRDVVSGIQLRLSRRKKNAARELSKKNLATKAPTAAYINRTGQALADQYFDNSLKLKSAQLDHDEFIVWNFDLIDSEELDDVENLGDVNIGKLLLDRYIYTICEIF
jgi:hypothetical protein